MMGPRLRKLALTAHVACSVGTLGSVTVFLALAGAGLAGRDEAMASAAYPAMELTASVVLVPLLLAALLTGVVQSLGTRWGLFRHYWVVAKLLLTLIVLGVVSLQLPLIAQLADIAAAGHAFSPDLERLRASPVLHAAGGLLVLLLPLALSIYKPSGLTRYGWRKQHVGQVDSGRWRNRDPRAQSASITGMAEERRG
jgi:hypothetical protein